MLRILVCSDSHGRADLLALAYDQQPKAEILVFLGDGVNDAALFRYSGKPYYIAKGNCDGKAEIPLWQEFTLEGYKILCTHGHQSYVKHSLDGLLRAAKERGAGLVLYGHTHTPRVDYEDGIYLFNPGSIYAGEYGFVDIASAGIVCRNLRVRR